MIGIAIFLLVTWLLLLIQLLLNLALTPSLSENAEPSGVPFVSIIVPARNEADGIGESVRSLLNQDYQQFEVIVVDDRSTDGTGEILQGLAATNGHLRVIRGEEPPTGWLGKPWALHQGTLVARGELLLFVDADITYETAALRSAVAFFLQRRPGALSIFPGFRMHGFWENVLIPWLPFLAFVELPVWIANRIRDYRLAIGGGPGNLVSRAAYKEIGGHESLRNAIIDDIGLARQVRAAGHPTIIVLGDRLVHLRMYRGLRQIVDGFTKNSSSVFENNVVIIAMVLVLNVTVHLVPYFLAIWGILQWFADGRMSLAAALGLGAVVLITLTRAILFRRLRYRMDSALLGHPLMKAVFLYILARSAWKVAIRRQLSWRGREYSAEGLTFGGQVRR